MHQIVRKLILAGLCTVPLMSAYADCPVLDAETAFVDLQGNLIDPTLVDPIALVETGNKVTVYQRSRNDAEELVRQLAFSGETTAERLDADAWMVAAAGTCSGDPGPGKKCTGVCPGKQRCKRIDKPGKDVCACVL